MFLIADGVCSDYTLATILTIVKRGLTVIQLVVPIILIVSGIFQLMKLMVNPDNQKKGLKVFTNSILSAVIVFFLPFIVNLTMSTINVNGNVGIENNGSLTAFDLSSCWVEIDEKKQEMDSATESTSTTIKEEEQEKIAKLDTGKKD